MADRYWVNGDADGNWNASNNWGSASNTVDDAGIPTTGDNVFFDSAVTANCTLSAAGATANMSMAAGYTGTLDINGQNIESQGDVTLAGAGAINFGGAGTWDIYGNLDWSALASTLEETGHTVRMLGATKTYAGNAQGMGSLEIHGDLSAGQASTYARLYGTLTVKAGVTLTCTSTYNFEARGEVTIEATGVITSASASRMYTYAIIVNSGTITGDFRMTCGAGSKISGTGEFSCGDIEFTTNTGWGPATFDNDSITITNTTGTDYTQTTYGDTTFNCPVSITVSGAGDLTIRNSIGNYDIEFTDDISVTESSTGVLIWTKGTGCTVAFSGGADQSIDLNDLSFEPLSFNKSGGTLTLAGGFTTEELTVESGSTGTIDLNDQDITITGDATFQGSGTITCGAGTITCGGHFSTTSQGTWTCETCELVLTGTTKNFVGKSAQTCKYLTVTGSYTVSGFLYPWQGTTDIQGSLVITGGGNNLYIYNNTSTTVSGSVTGTSNVLIRASTLTSMTGTWDVATTVSYDVVFTATGTFGGAFDFTGQSGGTRTVTFGSGTRVFSDNVTFDDLGGTYTISQAANGSLEFQGNVTVTSTGTFNWTKGTGTITLSGASASADFDGKTVEDIVVNSVGGTVTLTGNVTPDTLTLTAGTLDLDTFDVTTASYSQAAGTTLTAAGASNGSITTSGNVSISGTSGSGCVVTNAVFDVGGTGSASYTTVTDSDASADQVITATNSTDLGTNPGWVFSSGGGGSLEDDLYMMCVLLLGV